MRLRTVLMGAVALVFGLLAASSVYLLGARPTSAAPDSTSILVVTADVPRGVSLTPDMLELKPWPKEFVPAGAITSSEGAIDRTVWIPLLKGEPILDSKLASKGAGRGMASLVPPGMRAVTIQTPNVSTGVAGFILPGNKVDVLLTLSNAMPNNPMGGGETLTLLQNIEILAVDQRIEAPSENVVDPSQLRSVTLLVTPDEATKLDLGQNKGTLRLSLRNPEDSVTDPISSATLAELLHGSNVISYATPTAVAEVESELAVAIEASKPAGSSVEPPAESPKSTVTRIRTLRGISDGFVYLSRPTPTRSPDPRYVAKQDVH